MDRYRLRRFAGFTPYNAADRIRDRREFARPIRPQPCVRWFHYGATTWVDLFLALREPAYRAGDATRRQRRNAEVRRA